MPLPAVRSGNQARLFPDAISIFTFWLVIATILLGMAAYVQINFLRRGLHYKNPRQKHQCDRCAHVSTFGA
jgi:hypothetical protein